MTGSAMYANTMHDMCIVDARARWSVAPAFAAQRTVKSTIQVSLNGKHVGRPMASGGSTG